MLGVLLAAAGCFVMLLPPDAPKYQGRYLSDWLNRAIGATPGTNAPEIEEAEQAVRAIGTNALPYLLYLVEYELPTWRGTLFRRLPPSWPLVRDPAGRMLLGPESRSGRLTVAITGFEILGTNAAPAVPLLAAMMNDTKRTNATWRAVVVLRYIGLPAVPALTNALADPKHLYRHEIATSLLNIASESGVESTSLFLPYFRQLHNDPDDRVRGLADAAVRKMEHELNFKDSVR